MGKISLLILLFLVAWLHLAGAQDKAGEKIIYVPEKDWEKVLQTETKGIGLSYQQYLELLSGQKHKKKQLPTQVVVNKVEYSASIADQTLKIEMVMSLNCLSDDWQHFTFELGKMGVRQADLDGRQALLVSEQVMSRPHPQTNAFNQNIQQRVQQSFMQQQGQSINNDNDEPALTATRMRYRLLLQRQRPT